MWLRDLTSALHHIKEETLTIQNGLATLHITPRSGANAPFGFRGTGESLKDKEAQKGR